MFFLNLSLAFASSLAPVVTFNRPLAWRNTTSNLVNFTITDDFKINSSSINVSGAGNYTVNYCAGSEIKLVCAFRAWLYQGSNFVKVTVTDNESQTGRKNITFAYNTIGPNISSQLTPKTNLTRPASNFVLSYLFKENASRIIAYYDLFQGSVNSFDVANKSNFPKLGKVFSSIVPVVNRSNLGSLASSTIKNSFGTFVYNQYIDMAQNGSVVYTKDSQQANDPKFYLEFPASKIIYRYRLSFPLSINSRVDNQSHLIDLHDRTINILGRDFTIVDTRNATGEIILMRGSSHDRLNELEARKYIINGVGYYVEVLSIASGEVLFRVNGETSASLSSGDSYILVDGTRIGVANVSETQSPIARRQVEFYLGAQTVQLKDGSYAQGTLGNLSIDSGQPIVGVGVDLVGITNGSQTRISKIEIQWNSSNDYYISSSGNGSNFLSDRLNTSEKDKLFLRNFDYAMQQIYFGNQENITLNPASASGYRLTLRTKAGANLSFVAFHSNTSADCNLGQGDNRSIITSVNTPIRKDDSFIVSSNQLSHLIQVSAIDSANQIVNFTDIGTANTASVSTAAGSGTLYLDGFAYNFQVDYNNNTLNITDSSMGNDSAVLYTNNSAMVRLMDNGTNCLLNITERAHEQSPNAAYSLIVVVHDPGTGGAQPINIDAPATHDSYFSLISWGSAINFSTGYTSYGTFVEYNTSCDQANLRIRYPEYEARVNATVYSNLKWAIYTGFSTVSQAWYKLDGGNTKFKLNLSLANTTLPKTISSGQHTLAIYANDSFGNLNNLSLGTFYVEGFVNLTNFTKQMRRGHASEVKIYLMNGSQATGLILFNQTIKEYIKTNATKMGTNITINFTIYGRNIVVANASKPLLNASTKSRVASLVSSAMAGAKFDAFVMYQNMSKMIAENSYTNATGGAQWVLISIRRKLGRDWVVYLRDDKGSNFTFLSQCNGNNATKAPVSRANACYTNASKSVDIYLPHLSGAGLVNPNNAPTYRIVSPDPVINDSKFNLTGMVYQINLNTSSCYCNLTTEETKLVVAGPVTVVLVKGMTNYSFRASYTTVKGFWNLTNNLMFNVGISCATMGNRNRSTARAEFFVDDKTVPKVASTSAASITKATVNLMSESYDPFNYSIRYKTNGSVVSAGGNPEFKTEHIITITPLSPVTTYYYNYTFCDRAGNCNSSHTSQFKTAAEVDISYHPAGGGGGGGAIRSETTFSKYWDLLPGGQNSLVVYLRDYGLKKISFKTKKNAKKVTLQIQKLTAKPKGTAEINAAVYRYVQVSLTNLKDEDVDGAQIQFVVETDWLESNKVQPWEVVLKRFVDNNWVDLDTKIIEAGVHEINYEATAPGFSYFAITGATSSQAGNGTKEAKQNQTGKQSTANPAGNAVAQKTEAKPVTLSQKLKMNSGWLIALVSVITVVLVASSLLSYRVVQKKKAQAIKAKQAQQVAQPLPVIRLVQRPAAVNMEEQNLAIARRYVARARSFGKKDYEIAADLKQTGWPEALVNKAMQN